MSISAPSYPAPRAAVSTRIREAIDAHYDVLRRFLRRLGVDESEVEDAAQQVLLVSRSESRPMRGAGGGDRVSTQDCTERDHQRIEPKHSL